jgi:hypothetical protein
MASVIKRGFRTYDALNFIDKLSAVVREAGDTRPLPAGGVNHIVYAVLSKNTQWADELLPPTPVDSVDEETNFWSEIIGMKRIQPSDVTLVVPRFNWANGVDDFVIFDPSRTDAYGQKFYCMNSLYQVFIVNNITQQSPLTVTEPVYNTGAPIVNTNDGYEWRFLFDLSVSDINSTVQDNWIPVNIGTRQTANQIAEGDTQAEWTLGAKHVLLSTIIDDTGIPLNVSYRQLALVMDPLNDLGARLTSTFAVPADMTSGSGIMLYLNNRKEITRETGQSEQPKIVVTF